MVAARWDPIIPVGSSDTNLVIMERGSTNGEPTDPLEGYEEQENVTFSDHTKSHSAPPYQYDDDRQSFSVQNNANVPSANDDRAAVAALVQLRGSASERSQQPSGRVRVTESNPSMTYTPDMTDFYSHTRLFQSRSDTAAQPQTGSLNIPHASKQFSASTSYTDNQLQDTVSHLSSMFSGMQQLQALTSERQESMLNTLGQLTSMSSVVSHMQQQQALVSEKQEIISNTLGQLTSMLQDMRNGPQSYNVNHNNTVTEPRGTHLPTTDDRQQVQDFSRNQDGYENRGYRATQHDRLQDDGVSHLQGYNSQEGQVSHSKSNIPQNEWTEDSTLPNTTRGRNYQDGRVSQTYESSYQNQANYTDNDIQQEESTGNCTLSNATRGRNYHDSRVSQLGENTLRGQISHTDNNVQQEGWIENSTLSNNPRGRNYQDSRVSQSYGNPCQNQVSHSNNEVHKDGWTENCTLSNATKERNYQGSWQVRQPARPYLSDVKLPPFNGKEDWKVWITRFEAIAQRCNWNEDTRLDNLLPRLQGRAGDFVFNQLSYETMSSYSELVKELNSRFRTVETQRTFAAKFSQRAQKQDETVEEYAAELKRLYAKAYKSRDSKTRQEDLVRRFLDGMKDNEARFEIEFHKEPGDIDQAVYHPVNFIQTKHRNSPDYYNDRKFKKYVRRTSQESDFEDSENEQPEERDDYECALRVPTKTETYQERRPQKVEQRTEHNSNQSEKQPDSMAKIEGMVKALADKVEELQKGRRPAADEQQTSGNSGVLCYACHLRGHYARDCPNKPQAQRPWNSSNGQLHNQGKTECRGGQNASPLN